MHGIQRHMNLLFVSQLGSKQHFPLDFAHHSNTVAAVPTRFNTDRRFPLSKAMDKTAAAF